MDEWNQMSQNQMNDPTPQGNGTYSSHTEAPKKSKKKIWIPIVIIVIILMLLCCGGSTVLIIAVKNVVEKSENEQPELSTPIGIADLDSSSTDTPGETTLEAEDNDTSIDSDSESSQHLNYITPIASSDESSLADIVEEVLPSVVCINVVADVTYTQFGQSYTGQSRGSGSGVIISQDDDNLYIVTNNHVVTEDTSNTSSDFYYYYFSSSVTNIDMTVVFCDDSEVKATIRGTDEAKDLAVISIPLSEISSDTLSKIKAATIGDSNKIRLGDSVIAIGNALGYGQSVTTGIISALNRKVTFSDGYTRTLVQTDAAINPGNSGGGLFDYSGALVGINSAKNSSNEVDNMGFAIPISDVTDLIVDLINYSEPKPLTPDEQGFFGVSGQDLTPDLASVYGFPEGVYVTKVVEKSPAEKNGIHSKDIISKVNDKSISSRQELTNVISSYAGGDTVTITYYRLEEGSYEEHTVDVELAYRKDFAETSTKQR